MQRLRDVTLFWARRAAKTGAIHWDNVSEKQVCVCPFVYICHYPRPTTNVFFLPPFLHAYIQAFNQFIDWFGESLRNSAKQNNKLWGSKSKCPVLSPSPLYFCVHWNDKWEEGENLVHALVFLIAANNISRVFRLFMSNAPISKILVFNVVCREIQKYIVDHVCVRIYYNVDLNIKLYSNLLEM